MTRLHAADTLTDLATHDDAVGAWARDRLVLWYPEPALQTSATSRFAGLLGPEGIVHAIDNGTPVTRSMALMHTGLLGAMDPEHSGLVDALTRALDLGHAPTTLLAANALAWCGALPAARLADVVQSGTDRPLMGATVLLAQPTASVATSVVGELDDTGLMALMVRLGAPSLVLGSDIPEVDRFDVLLTAGARAGGWTDHPGLKQALGGKHRGSARSRARRVVLALLSDLDTPLARALHAAYSASRGDELGVLGPVWTGWVYGRSTQDADPRTAVSAHHAWTVPTVLAAARNSDADTASVPQTPGDFVLAALTGATDQRALALDALFDSASLRHREPLRLLWAPVASGAPEPIARALREQRDLLVAFQGAGYCGTEEVLAALLDLDLPPSGPATAVYALALLNSGDRAVLPRLRPLLAHLPRAAVGLAQGLFPDL